MLSDFGQTQFSIVSVDEDQTGATSEVAFVRRRVVRHGTAMTLVHLY